MGPGPMGCLFIKGEISRLDLEVLFACGGEKEIEETDQEHCFLFKGLRPCRRALVFILFPKVS